MLQKILISAGNQAFEFEGQILDINDDFLLVKIKNGEVYIERKYLVFIQFLDDEEVVPKEVNDKPVSKNAKTNDMARFINQRLKHDPLNQKLVPMSQLPDNLLEETEVGRDYEDLEAEKNILIATYGPDHPAVKANNLKQAAQAAMNNTEFSMGPEIECRNPLQTILKRSKCKL